jgi:hypothetical protein
MMMRLPIGSMPALFGSTKRMRPWPTNVFGTVFASTTRIHLPRGSDAKPLGGLANLLIRQLLGDAVHARVVLPHARLEVGHLLHEVVGGEAGEVGRLGMAEAGHQVAGATRERAGVPFCTIDGAGLCAVGKPVRRVEEVVDLARRVALRAALDLFRSGGLGRELSGLHRKGPRRLARRGLGRAVGVPGAGCCCASPAVANPENAIVSAHPRTVIGFSCGAFLVRPLCLLCPLSHGIRAR